MRLLLVESPAKARTLEALLDGDFLVRATRGHIRDLPKSGLGVDPARRFRPQWRSVPAARKEMAALESEAFLCREILLATDPDREGESIAAHLSERLRKTRRPCRRVRLTELTTEATGSAIALAGEIDESLVEAQTARRVLDRLIGYTVSPTLAASTENRAATGIGRVAAATLGLLSHHEKRTAPTDRDPLWRVEIDWISSDGREIQTTLDALFPDEKAAADRARDVTGIRATIASATPRRSAARTGTGLTTYDLLIQASSGAGLTSPETMRAAQRLYEGIPRADLPPLALTSYPRTDDDALPAPLRAAAYDFLHVRYGMPHPPAETDSQSVRTHGCIRPLSFEFPPDTVRPFLSPAEFRVYEFIWDAALNACRPAISSTEDTPEAIVLDAPIGRIAVSVSLLDEPDVRVATPQVLGRLANYRDGGSMPVKAGDMLTASRVHVRPEVPPDPGPLRDGSLVEAMRKAGIARPGTCARSIQALVDRGYARRDPLDLQTTRLGRHVLAVLDERFPDLTNPSFTRRMEEDLDAIAAGRTDYETVVSSFYESWVLPALSGAQTPRPARETRRNAPRDASARCPDCGRPLVERQGRFGAFLGCTGFPKCRFTRPV